VFVLIATIFEVAGDALIRKCIYNYEGTAGIVFFIVGALLVFCYGFSLNLAPVEFRQVVGLYIATLFVVWQIGNYISFKTLPTLPIIIGGVLIVTGGLNCYVLEI
jgi:small multidrug resistance family-3 protein